MSFESPQFSEPIQAERPEVHEEMLNDRIAEIGLKFLRKRAERNDDESHLSLLERVERLTPLEGIVFRPLMNCEKPLPMDAEMTEICKLELKERINGLDQDLYQDEEILEIVKDLRSRVIEYVARTRTGRAEEGREEKKKQLVEIEPLRRLAGLNPDSRHQSLLNHGFLANDSVLEIHIKPAFRAERGKIQLGDIERGFERVANQIVNRDRSAKAVVGCSWLMDTPIAKRLGFVQVPEAELPLNDFSTWFQFVDENGQIHQDRVNKMLETGELPFRNMLGYAPTEDFLRRYLSEERKEQGPVVLDELIPEEDADVNRIRELTLLANKDWDQEIAQTGRVDFDRYVEEHPVVSEIMNLYPEEDRQAVAVFMHEIAEKGILQKDIAVHTTGPIRRANAMFNQRIYRKLHRPKELDLSKAEK